jgi:hypothetical protein
LMQKQDGQDRLCSRIASSDRQRRSNNHPVFTQKVR